MIDFGISSAPLKLKYVEMESNRTNINQFKMN